MGISDRSLQAAALPGRIAITRIRPDHGVAILYFAYTAVLAWRFQAPNFQLLASFLAPAILFLYFYKLPQLGGFLRDIASDWLPMALILIAYRQLELFSTPITIAWQTPWLHWDRLLLHSLGLQHSIESAGGLIPELLQGTYLGLYAVPVLALAAVYAYGARPQAWRFLQSLLAGTFLVYALIPHFPTDSPRQLVPYLDQPHFQGFLYSINVWLLDHADISTGVFPSGHVAVAISSALGLRRVLPGHKAIFRIALAVTALVYLATIYGRFHYAVDGAASILLCLMIHRALEAMDARA